MISWCAVDYAEDVDRMDLERIVLPYVDLRNGRKLSERAGLALRAIRKSRDFIVRDVPLE